MIRGVRGAITITQDTPGQVRVATQLLINKMVEDNEMKPEDIASIIFSVTSDITSQFPAATLREIGFEHVPLLDVQHMEKEGGLEKCIRVLMHWNTNKSQTMINHVYLEDAVYLRPDLKG